MTIRYICTNHDHTLTPTLDSKVQLSPRGRKEYTFNSSTVQYVRAGTTTLYMDTKGSILELHGIKTMGNR